MARINVIGQEEATGRLKEVYDGIIASRGKLAEVHQIQSLRPESIVAHMQLYMEIMFSRSELSRAEREMMAVVVSACNDCEYCQEHHAAALNHYWKDDERVRNLRRDLSATALSERERALCEYAYELTLTPANTDIAFTNLVKQGLSDAAILDASLVVAYFNFVNRMVLGLGVELEKQPDGYEY